VTTKFKMFTGDEVQLENALNFWIKDKEKVGCTLIDEVHFSADGEGTWSVLVKYSEWEPAYPPKDNEPLKK